MKFRHATVALATTILMSCSSGTSSSSTSIAVPASATDQSSTTASVAAVMPDDSSNTVTPTTTSATAKMTLFTAEVWADNWFSLYINGKLVGQDSVPITTEKSFNSERITFTASYPFTIAMVTKDFKQNDTGLEYIGTDRQQIGDGGFVAQFTDNATGKVVALTNNSWRGLVIHQAPLNTSCEKSTKPEAECASQITTEPSGWTQPAFSDSSWPAATVYSKEEVGVKDGYNNISWSSNAQLIWTSDLKIDNTILWRYTVAA